MRSSSDIMRDRKEIEQIERVKIYSRQKGGIRKKERGAKRERE